MAKKDISQKLLDRSIDIMEMLADIPIPDIREQIQYLLGATKSVNLGREQGVVTEPDNAVRLRTVEILLEQGAGAAGRRKPIEAPADEPEVAAIPTGSLRPAAKAIIPPEKTANT